MRISNAANSYYKQEQQKNILSCQTSIQNVYSKMELFPEIVTG